MKGFTLLEVLVSLGILVIVTGALHKAYTGNLEVIEIARDQEISYQTARVVMDLMERDLSSAVGVVRQEGSEAEPDPRLGFLGESAEHQGLSADRMSFTCTTHLVWTQAGARTDFCEVGYALEPDGESGALTLFRRDQVLPDGDLEAGGETVALSRDVTSLELRFFDREGTGHEAWDSASRQEQERLPARVRIRLTVRGVSGREAAFTTEVHPALAAPAEAP